MNIDDVTDDQVQTPVEGKIMAMIFKHQHDLAVKYGPIERRNGFWCPDADEAQNMDDPQFQNWLKNMFWRATEEVAEAFEVFPDLKGDWKPRWERDADLRHFFEELADALHFIVEASIVSKAIDAERIEQMWADDRSMTPPRRGAPTEELARLAAFNVLFQLGLAANTLKNKPWKSTHMQTDFAKFKFRLNAAWQSFIKLWTALGCSQADVFGLYFKKMKVNQFRQETNY